VIVAVDEHSGKRCTRCGEVKPASAFSRVKKRGREYLRPYCRKCHTAATAAWRTANPGKRNEQQRRHRRENHAESLAKEAAMREANREAYNERLRAWRSRNKERRNAWQAEWRARNREQIRKGWLDWRDRNYGHFRAKANAWQKAHPEQARARDAARRARLTGAGGKISRKEILQLLAAQKGRCWWCTKKVDRKYHADHRIPVSRGGTSDKGNIVIACSQCNWSKGAKTPAEFAGRLF
jgi:hypothetical protein